MESPACGLNTTFTLRAGVDRVWPPQLGAGASLEVAGPGSGVGPLQLIVGPVGFAVHGEVQVPACDAAGHLVIAKGCGCDSPGGGRTTASDEVTVRLTTPVLAPGDESVKDVVTELGLSGLAREFGRAAAEAPEDELTADFAASLAVVSRTAVPGPGPGLSRRRLLLSPLPAVHSGERLFRPPSVARLGLHCLESP